MLFRTDKTESGRKSEPNSSCKQGKWKGSINATGPPRLSKLNAARSQLKHLDLDKVEYAAHRIKYKYYNVVTKGVAYLRKIVELR